MIFQICFSALRVLLHQIQYFYLSQLQWHSLLVVEKKLFSLLFAFNKLLLQKKSSILFQKILIACHKLLVKTVLLSWCKCNPLSPKCFLFMLLLSIVWICNSLINLFVFRMVGFAFVLSVCTINLFMITQDFGSDPSIFFLMWSIYLWSFVEYQLLHCWYQHGS